ncbi:MAG: TldD/PmbA family protein [Candidatus Heimdallarchaeota archaeon]|nr:TldD/PmbA family protein [Candidatus Heimdallarchaeota archaeon]
MIDLGELAIKKALKLGMDEAETYIERIKVINAEHADEIQSFKVVDSLGLGIRVAKGKKIGLHATTILTEKEVEGAVEKAVQIAKVTPEDPNWVGFNQKFGSAKVEGIYDKSLTSLDYEKIADTIVQGINYATENDRKVRVTRGSLSIFIVNNAITNSYHETVVRDESTVNAYLMTKAVEGGDSTGFQGMQKRNWRELDYQWIANEATEQALKYVRSKTIESTKLPVIMKNSVFGSIFGLMLGTNVNSESNQKGRSTFATKRNTQIADERITCIDNGLLKNGYRTRQFDCEGHPLQKTPIIEKGVLKNFIYDHYRAQKENVQSTGNARRDYHAQPTPSLNNFILSLGTASLDDMIKDTKKGFLVERTIGQWLSKPSSGQLNATVTHGYMIENGELTQPVNNVIIAGNFFELLQNKVDTIGNDQFNQGNIYTPSIKFSEMTIAGK